ALAQLVRLGLRQGQRRDVVQRGRDRGQGPEKRRNMPEGLQFGKRNGRRLPEGSGGRPTQGRKMAYSAQSLRQIAPERADIGALAAANHEICMVPVGTTRQFKPLDGDPAGLEVDLFALASEIV